MNPSPDPILDQLLVAVRATKRRRQWRRGALATMACGIAAVCFLLPKPHREAPHSVAVNLPTAPSGIPAEDNIAVLVWYDGTPLLEKMNPDELGSVELAFGLEPVIAYPDEAWGGLPN